MAWDKFLQREFIAVWSRLPSDEKRIITQEMEALSVDPPNYHPTPVLLMNGDFLIAALRYWIQYRLDKQNRRIIFIRLRTD